jgi:hypothetical protein
MTDQPKPRRRWKRWIALGLVLVICCGAWMANRESPTVRKAQQLQLGQTVAEVEAMGRPVTSRILRTNELTDSPVSHVLYFSTPFEQRQFFSVLWLRQQLAQFGLEAWRPASRWPVEVHFDPSGHSHWFRRGSEVVGP